MRESDIADFLHWITDGEPLTTIAERLSAVGARKPQYAEQACSLRADGLSYREIADRLPISLPTVISYIEALDPDLAASPSIRRRNGAKLGQGSKLSDYRLRVLHVLHRRESLSVNELARRTYVKLGYASAESAREGIRRGWQRLGLLRVIGSRCEAITQQGRNRGQRCSRFALKGQRYCYMHADPQRAAQHAERMRMAA